VEKILYSLLYRKQSFNRFFKLLLDANVSRREKEENRKVKTLRLIVDAAHLETPDAEETLARAAEILRGGGLVALPTETVYGLGANALDAAAAGRIFAAKQRPAWDPLIVHIADLEMLETLVTAVPDAARRLAVRRLMDAFWPGPLTLLLPRTSAVPDAVTAGRALVGLRMPAHPVALKLIRLAGVPVAAPSANTFGHTSPTTAAHVLEDLDGRIDAVLDAGPAACGVESTVIDPGQSPMMIYRPGAVTAEQIREVGGAVEIFASNTFASGSFESNSALAEMPREALPSPGVGLRHYAPRARLLLVEGPPAELEARLAEAAKGFAGARLGVMLPEELGAPVEAAVVYPWGQWAAPERLARELFAGLRALDAQGCTVILCPLPPAEGIGAAIRDRLRKAGHKVEHSANE
jgi:L-threonylcarbamoyladenylate synthase